MTYHNGNQLIDPQFLFDKAQLQPGMHVVDLGCGRTGHVVFPASMVVGDKGVIYAVDILKDVLELVRKRAQLENIVNVHTVWADIEKAGGIAIAKKTVDVVFIINVLYHFSDYTTTLNESAQLLKNKGRIVVVDWVSKLGGLGPHNGKFVDFGQVKSWARSSGFGVQEDVSVGPYHRCVVLYRNS